MTRRGATTAASALLVAAWLLTGPAGVAAATGTCDDLLVSHGPGGSSGDVAAVTITAQTLERGVPGWSSATWEAAPDAHIREVHVVTEDGTDVLAGSEVGTSGPALELRFCGTVGAVGEPAGVTGEVSVDDTLAAASDGRPGSGPSAGSGLEDGVAVRGTLGATVGLAVGVVVLLLSRGARGRQGVAR